MSDLLAGQTANADGWSVMTDFLGREYNIETWLPSVERLDLFRAFTHAGEDTTGLRPANHGWRRGASLRPAQKAGDDRVWLDHLTALPGGVSAYGPAGA